MSVGPDSGSFHQWIFRLYILAWNIGQISTRWSCRDEGKSCRFWSIWGLWRSLRKGSEAKIVIDYDELGKLICWETFYSTQTVRFRTFDESEQALSLLAVIGTILHLILIKSLLSLDKSWTLTHKLILLRKVFKKIFRKRIANTYENLSKFFISNYLFNYYCNSRANSSRYTR